MNNSNHNIIAAECLTFPLQASSLTTWSGCKSTLWCWVEREGHFWGNGIHPWLCRTDFVVHLPCSRLSWPYFYANSPTVCFNEKRWSLKLLMLLNYVSHSDWALLLAQSEIDKRNSFCVGETLCWVRKRKKKRNTKPFRIWHQRKSVVLCVINTL